LDAAESLLESGRAANPIISRTSQKKRRPEGRQVGLDTMLETYAARRISEAEMPARRSETAKSLRQ